MYFFLDSEKKRACREKIKKDSLKGFAALCISLMHGEDVNHCVMGGVVRNVCIVEQLVKCHFFLLFLPLSSQICSQKQPTSLFIISDPKLSLSLFFIPLELLFAQSKQHLKQMHMHFFSSHWHLLIVCVLPSVASSFIILLFRLHIKEIDNKRRFPNEVGVCYK